MPNGGSDCCGTCWFNARNKNEAGYAQTGRNEGAYCLIRDFAIEDAFYTYCGNHPHRRPQRDPVPIGPVFVAKADGGRRVSRPSPDTEDIRQHLLTLVARIIEKPASEYPIGTFVDELLVWQLGDFKEARAVVELRRIASFKPGIAEDGPFGRTRQSLAGLAQEALRKIGAGPR